MRLLLLSDHVEEPAVLLPAVTELAHEVVPCAPDGEIDAELAEVAVVLIDGTGPVPSTVGICRRLTASSAAAPALLVLEERVLAVVKVSWGFDDWVLPSVAAPALDTRLRILDERAEAGHRDRIEVGAITIDTLSYEVRAGERGLDLTPTEFDLLRVLAANAGRALTREVLLERAWGYDYYGGSRTVDVHVRRLRSKLGPEFERMVETVRGVGYRLAAR